MPWIDVSDHSDEVVILEDVDCGNSIGEQENIEGPAVLYFCVLDKWVQAVEQICHAALCKP